MVLTVSASIMLGAFASAAEPAYIAIVMDDMGNNLHLGNQALDLPGPITYSVLPNSRYATLMAERANAAGKEVMIHMPMANISHKAMGPGALEPALDHDSFLALLDAAMEQVPYARGMNNHMGSYLTQQPVEMNWLMDEVKKRNLFFVDSRTTAKTVALRVAREKAVFSSSRDVFLDNELNFHAIDRSFSHLVAMARRRGTAIAICHPHQETLDYLKLALPALEQQNINLVPVSNLIALQKIMEVQFAAKKTNSTESD